MSQHKTEKQKQKGEEKKKQKRKRKESGGNMSDLNIGHSHLIVCDDTLSCVMTSCYHV